MIDVKQLRLRNLITNNQRITIRVDFISKSQIGYNCGFGDVFLLEEKDEFEFYENACNFEPIELTQEWLVRFGFLKTNQWAIVYSKKENANSLNHALRLTDNENAATPWSVYLQSFIGDEGFGFISIRKDLKYVHELQNLYFALSGEDLELIK